MDRAEIVVVGSYNRDVVLFVDHLPAPGETCLSLGRMETPGGKGSNQAIQAARCGASVAMLAAIGADDAGEAAIGIWTGTGIQVGAVARLNGQPTGMAMILVDRRGENSIVVHSGANARLAPEHVEAAAGTIRSAKLVLAQLETPADATKRAFQLAREAGVRTVLNAAPAPDAADTDLLALTDILIVNEVEGLSLTGQGEPSAIGQALLNHVAEAVVVTLGSQGAVLFRRAESPRRRPSPSIEVVDTTGAGDAFIGAFAASLVLAGDLGGALDWGVAAGALACTAKGAAASFADRPAIAKLGEHIAA